MFAGLPQGTILPISGTLFVVHYATDRVLLIAATTVGGTVPATLSLTLGAPATFGAFTPGVAREYNASSTANVISTAASGGGPFGNVGGSANPTTLKTWANPVSNDEVALAFKQAIGANDALRTGAYSKTLTFTLSTTQP